MLSAHLIAASLAAAPIPETPRAEPPVQAPTVGPVVIAPPPPASGLPGTGSSDPIVRPHDAERTARPVSPVEVTLPADPSADTALSDDFELGPDEAGLAKDPLEGFNRVSFTVSQGIDKVLIRPAAMVYRAVVPKPARDGAHNVLSNLGEPLVFVNDLLQLRPARMIRTLGRFLINSTLGLGGLFDVARSKPFHLPHHANGFGSTLGYYGVKPGPYIYLPIIGPTTLRDMVGSAEGLIPPMVVGKPFDRKDYQITTNVVDGLDQRERADDDLKAMLRDAIDPYATFRANYLQNRAGEIAALKSQSLDPDAGATTEPSGDPSADPLADPMTDSAAPAAEPAPASQ